MFLDIFSPDHYAVLAIPAASLARTLLRLAAHLAILINIFWPQTIAV